MERQLLGGQGEGGGQSKEPESCGANGRKAHGWVCNKTKHAVWEMPCADPMDVVLPEVVLAKSARAYLVISFACEGNSQTERE